METTIRVCEDLDLRKTLHLLTKGIRVYVGLKEIIQFYRICRE